MMLGKAMTVGKLGVFLLQMSAIRQKDSAEISGRVRTESRSIKAPLDQQRQIAGMIEMGMRQEDRGDPSGINRQRRPILQAQRLETLKQTTVDETGAAVFTQRVFRTGN